MNNKGSSKPYIVGFVLSMLLTLLAYFFVTNQILHGGWLIAAIIGLALVQLMVQLLFFLHLGQESKPRWNFIFFLATVSLILLVVIGSLWIMNHLNYNMTPKEINTYMLKEEGMHK